MAYAQTAGLSLRACEISGRSANTTPMKLATGVNGYGVMLSGAMTEVRMNDGPAHIASKDEALQVDDGVEEPLSVMESSIRASHETSRTNSQYLSCVWRID